MVFALLLEGHSMDTPRTMTSKIEPETHPHSSAYACGSLQNNGTLHASQKHTEACVLLANHALCKDAITPKATATRMQPPRTAQRDVVVCCGVIVRFFLSALYRGEPNSTELGKKNHKNCTMQSRSRSLRQGREACRFYFTLQKTRKCTYRPGRLGKGKL